MSAPIFGRRMAPPRTYPSRRPPQLSPETVAARATSKARAEQCARELAEELRRATLEGRRIRIGHLVDAFADHFEKTARAFLAMRAARANRAASELANERLLACPIPSWHPSQTTETPIPRYHPSQRDPETVTKPYPPGTAFDERGEPRMLRADRRPAPRWSR